MSNYLIVSDVSDCLVQALAAGFVEPPDPLKITADQIVLQSPTGLKNAQLSVFLYRLTEAAHSKNQPVSLGRGGRIRKAPLALELHYMITPHFKDSATRNQVIGKVLSILYDRPTLYLADRSGETDTPRDEVSIILNSVPLDELARVWESLQEAYQLSLCYIARVALLDSLEEQFVAPVRQKQAHYGEPLNA